MTQSAAPNRDVLFYTIAVLMLMSVGPRIMDRRWVLLGMFSVFMLYVGSTLWRLRSRSTDRLHRKTLL
jgi:hypothetical protein